MSEGIQRRLAAILAADVAGYSRLMGEDEAGTLRALRRLRTENFTPTVDGHRGRIVKNMGDGWLVEFESVVDAVTCAIKIQEALVGHEIIKLRLGIHLGDVTRDEEDIFGRERLGLSPRQHRYCLDALAWASAGAHRRSRRSDGGIDYLQRLTDREEDQGRDPEPWTRDAAFQRRHLARRDQLARRGRATTRKTSWRAFFKASR